jgi:serine acetyltransferase/GT2 family glycosyltransferase
MGDRIDGELKVSVVIPTYNRLTEIRRLVRELDCQSLSPSSFEVIVVDDGSDEDVKAALEAEDHHFALTVHRRDHGGSAAARQWGAEQARGHLLVFVDDDMHVQAGFLAAHVRAHAGRDRAAVLGRRRAASSRSRREVIERYRLRMGDRLADDIAQGRVTLTGEYLYTGNLSVATEFFREVGGFDVALRQLDDAELGIRLGEAGATFVLSEEAFNVHERDPMTRSQWLARARRDGVYWSRVGRKHPGVREASPWHWLEVVHPLSRPALALGALAPRPMASVARAALVAAAIAGRLRLERVAMAGVTFTYGVVMFGGVGAEAGGPMAAARDYRAFRCRTRCNRRPMSALRDLLSDVSQDHAMLVETSQRYDERERDLGSVAKALVVNSGFQLVVGYRVMRFLRRVGPPLAPRVMAKLIRHAFGSDIHWDADLGPGLVIVHGFGLAISHAASSGRGCILYQNVTLGVGREGSTGRTGAPTLGDGVVVGPGAALLGPIAVGDAVKVMANCTVSEPVPAHTIVHAPRASMSAS